MEFWIHAIIIASLGCAGVAFAAGTFVWLIVGIIKAVGGVYGKLKETDSVAFETGAE